MWGAQCGMDRDTSQSYILTVRLATITLGSSVKQNNNNKYIEDEQFAEEIQDNNILLQEHSS